MAGQNDSANAAPSFGILALLYMAVMAVRIGFAIYVLSLRISFLLYAWLNCGALRQTSIGRKGNAKDVRVYFSCLVFSSRRGLPCHPESDQHGACDVGDTSDRCEDH